MKQDADKYAVEDKKKREEVDKRNEADALVASIDKLLSESADKISDDHKKQLEAGKEDLKKAIETNETDKIVAETEKVQKVVYEVSAELYKQDPAAGAEAAGQDPTAEQAENADADKKDDNVVDADFSEVETEKK